ncbi:MAG TPA: hypothetical protein PL131_11610 [Methylotenera sp.]|nr:hypothetical protein [Methylotenera sp.]HPH06512.1 hypothetical protein [Methylotenera sp.]HPN02003.1 hypothetical protein [Methylotenera sp.]
MSFARWWFERFREFRSFRWYFNPRWVNVESGERAEPALRLQLNEAAQPDEAGRVHVPPELEEIRQAYENKSIDLVELFRKRSNRIYAKLDVCAEKGITNAHLMRRDLFSYSKTLAFMGKYKFLVWVLFILGLFGLAALDFAPTLLVFEALMESDTVSIGAALGLDDDTARMGILILSTMSFLMIIVLIGHVVAKLVASSYLDGEVPVFGIVISLVVALVFIDVAWIREAHEVKSIETSYEAYVKTFKKDITLGRRTAEEKPLLIDEWKPGYITRAMFSSAIFVLISIMIFIVAVYFSLWRVYGDIRMITRHFKQNRYRTRCAQLTAELRNEANLLNNSWEKLRQSAQMEVEQFMIGVRQGLHKNLKEYENGNNTLSKAEAAISAINKEFSKRLELPHSFTNAERTFIPNHEEEWGLRYSTFLTEAVLYEAFEKGTKDAINLGIKNPESAVDAIVDYKCADEKSVHWLPGLNKEECDKQYEAGFIEGSQVPHGAAWTNARLRTQAAT